MSIKRYIRGTAVRIKVTVRDQDDALHDPTSIVVSLSTAGNDGAAVITEQSMTQLSTGVYVYDFQTTGATPLGIYDVMPKVVSSSKTVIDRDTTSFELVA